MSKDKACKIEWITIPAPDLEAAKAFYSSCFFFLLEHYSESFVVFKAGNLSGGLDRDLEPSSAGIGFSLTVASMSKAIDRITANGGTILRDPYELGPSAGYCAKFTDPNGNVLELYSPEL